ncbi:MAG: cell division protein FtsZ [Hyphomicrobiaceae bacterium]|nr:MAG: cell division protein FtsZ [Hyphomicrobiaceae bacterium]
MKPRIAVIGVGGAGGNAVNNMIAAGLTGAQFMVANTDAQALAASSAERHIQLGTSLTEGLGAGSKPEIGEAAAEEALDDIRAAISDCHMVFIAAGMGGGTGTGAASVIARVAKEFGILTVAVVTKPFHFEGSRRMRVAEAGVAELRKHVDTLLVIPNQNLFRVATDRTTFAEAFVLADQVLYSGIACIVDLIVKEGLINLDLADVRTVLSGMGTAMMGTGEASGEQRAIVAAEEAIVNPLLDEVTLKGAKSLLLSITGGHDLTLWEVDEAANRVRQEVDPDANIIVGATFDESLGDRVRVSIVASGMARSASSARAPEASNWTPGSRRAPAPRADAADDYHRRLSEAIGDFGPQQGQAQPEAEPAEDNQGWRAPGDVYIREAPPQLSALSPAMRAKNNGEAAQDAKRGTPRMPSVEDFPPVGQREYWAKSGDGKDRPARQQDPAQSQQRQADSPRPKTSLLRRLTGGGRDKRKGAEGQPEGDRAGFKNGAAQGEEQVDLPVFFGRKKH